MRDNRHCPEATVNGCTFQFRRALFRRIHLESLQRQYEEDIVVRTWLRRWKSDVTAWLSWGHSLYYSCGTGCANNHLRPVLNSAWSCTLFLTTVKLLINAPGVYWNTDLETPAFNRDPASIRTLAVSPLRLLMSVLLFQNPNVPCLC